jgi:hypothetical protein
VGRAEGLAAVAFDRRAEVAAGRLGAAGLWALIFIAVSFTVLAMLNKSRI